MERVGCEDQPQTAAELQQLVQALTAAFLECFRTGECGALGAASRGELHHEWLSALLLTPLLRAACRWVHSGYTCTGLMPAPLH